MATSLTPVTVPKNTWVDIYAASGITPGTQMIIQNTGSSEAKLYESAVQPIASTGYNIIPPRLYLTSETIPVGAWAFSETGTTLQCEEA